MPCFKASTKILLFILLMCSFESLRAQVIFGEDFESTFPPANWTLFNYSSSNPWEQGAAGTGLNGSRSMAQYTTDVNSDAWIYTRGVTLTSGINYKLSYWYKISPLQVIGKLKVVLTNGVPPTNTTTTTVLHDLSFINNTVYQQGNDVFTVPVSGIYYIGFNAYTSPNQYALHVDSIVLQQTSGATCSGTPPVGTPTAVSTICPDSSFVLSMTGIVAGAGVGYQWQVSDAGQNNFVNIPGGTSEKFTTTQKINKDYRCIATCSFTGLSSTSNIISVTSPAVCYCAPYGSNCTQAAIQNVTFGGINNSSGCGSPTGYSNYATTVAAATVAAGATVPIAVTVGNGQQQYLTVGIDFNKNGSFDAGEVYSVGNGIGQTIFGTIAIPATAPAGITRMRLRIANNYYSPDNCVLFGNGEVEDYSVNITPYICTGTPVPGFMTGPSYVCSGTAFTLNVAGTFTGNVVQWESSPAGANNFTAIPGANTQSLTTSQTSSNDYRCRISCVASGTTAVSTVRAVTTPVLCYCLISNGCINSSYNITNVAFAGINNSSTCLTTGDYTSTVAPATVNAGASTPITVTVAGGTNSSAVAVWIDYNKNGSFEAAEFTAVGTYAAAASFTASVFIASNALPGNTRMRVMRRVGSPLTGTDACNAFAGDIEDYTVNIVAAPIAIYFTPFKDTLYNSTITIRARIVQKDVGINITNPLQPKLWGKRQGTTVWKSFDGQLASGTSNDGNWDFAVNQEVLGLRRNGCDSVQFYFVAQDLNAPPNIGYLPETGAAHSNVNTPVTPPAIPFGYRLKPRMKDTIYVSSGDCRYRSLTAANGLFQDIKTKRLEGNLTILIESDITEDGSHELNKYGINGFTVKIRPASNSLKTIGGNAFYGLIQLDNVKNVLIDGSFNGTGRYLKFDNQETSSMLTDSINVLVIRNSCDSITIRNSIFQHKSYLISPATAGETTLLLKNSNKNIFILNNYFTNNGTSFPERHIASAGANNNVTIKGNEFNNFTKYGIRTFANCSNWIIDSNHFYRTSTPAYYSSNYSAISTMGGGHTISNNYIGGQAPFCAGAAMSFENNPSSAITGITSIGYTGNPVNIISGNTVDNITMGLTFAARATTFYGISASNNTCIIKNNTIGNPQSATATIVPLASFISGIVANGTGNKEIRDNIITSITNKQGGGPDYDNISMTAISGGDNAPIPNISNQPNIISGNKIFNFRTVNSTTAGSRTIGIACGSGFNNIIEKNIIYDLSRESGTVTGIQYANGDSSGLTVIQRNRMYNFYVRDNFLGIVNGIGLEEVRSSVDIINNQVTLNNNDVANGITINGIYENGPVSYVPYPNSKKRILYNTVRIGGTSSGTTGISAGLYLNNGSNGLNREVYNNIFFNERTGGSLGNYAVRTYGSTQQPALPNTRANYNYYVLADTLSFFQGNSFPLFVTKTWSGWKNYFNFDDSSYIGMPADVPSSRLFVNKVTGNLNININDSICWQVNNKAKPYAAITADYDSLVIRSTAIINGLTDIGSDEFITNLPEPGSFCAGTGTSLTSNITGNTYQWQQKIGNSFVDIINNINYSGATTAKLTLTNVPFSWNGQQYRCMVNGSSFSQTFTIIVNQTLTTTLAISTPVTTACSGSTVTFTATATNTGAAPVYQWKKNGQNTGTNSAVYTSNALINGDVITAVLTTGLACTSSQVTTSNAITMTITPSLNTSATISGTTDVPNSNPVTLLTLAVVNQGSNPTYQWQDSSSGAGWKNIAGAINTTLNYTLLVSGTKIRCNVTSTNSCLGLNVAVSNTLELTLKSGIVGGSGLRLFPNPVKTILTIDSLRLGDEWQNLEVITAYGAQALSINIISNNGSVNINVTTLPPGIYFAVLTRKNGTREYLKFIKI